MNTAQMKQRIADTQAKQRDTSVKTTTIVNVNDLNKWMDNGFSKNKFASEVINLSDVFKEKMQYLLFGKPIIAERVSDEDQLDEDNAIEEQEASPEGQEAPKNNKEDKKVKDFLKRLKLQDIMFANEGYLWDHGRSYIYIDKKPNGKATLGLAQKGFPNIITYAGDTKIGATIYIPYVFQMIKYWLRMDYTLETITTSLVQPINSGLFPLAKPETIRDNLQVVSLDVINKHLPKTMQISGTIPNPYGFIPVVEMTYKPSYDKSWETLDAMRPSKKVEGLQKMLNEGTRALRTELYLNKTKIMVDIDMLNADNTEQLSKIAEEGIIGVFKDSGAVDDESGKQVEIIQGDPKVEQYWANIFNTISTTSQILKLSELNSENGGGDSATGEIFNKGNDVETANTLLLFRQEQISEILTKAWAIENDITFDEEELDTSNWSVQIIPNVIMNEAKMTEIVTKQLSSGLINMSQAVAKLEGISLSDAKTRLSQDDGIYNPALEAVTSFGDDKGTNAEANEEPIKPDGKEVVESK